MAIIPGFSLLHREVDRIMSGLIFRTEADDIYDQGVRQGIAQGIEQDIAQEKKNTEQEKKRADMLANELKELRAQLALATKTN